MKENHSYYRQEIEKSKRRLADMEARGIEAMSRYDVEIAYGGNGQMALDQGKQLVSSHISWYTEKLNELGPEVRQVDMFGALPAPASHDEEAQLERAITHDFSESEDGHLEDDYDLRQGEGLDDVDDGLEDYEPSPYDGTYSEE